MEKLDTMTDINGTGVGHSPHLQDSDLVPGEFSKDLKAEERRRELEKVRDEVRSHTYLHMKVRHYHATTMSSSASATSTV
jgi:hypothetical protein